MAPRPRPPSAPAHPGASVPGRRPPPAFTLLEMLVAIALAAALLGSMFAFSWDLLATRRRVVAEMERRRAAAVLVEHLERDLLARLVGDAVVGAGVAGDATTVRVLGRSVPLRLASSGGAAALADLEQAAYRFDAAGGTLRARRSVVAPGAGSDPAGEEWLPLGEGLGRVRFRYHDGRRWRDRFDSRAAGRLPAAVEVAVWYDAPGEDPDAPARDDPADGEADDPAPVSDEGILDDEPLILRDDDVDRRPPDRLRVIVIPDAAPPADEGGASTDAEPA